MSIHPDGFKFDNGIPSTTPIHERMEEFGVSCLHVQSIELLITIAKEFPLALVQC